MPAHDPVAVRALAERLVAISSVSPDVAGETRCARALIESLPHGIEHGTWPTPDGRPVVWARLRGKSPRTLLLLGHYDTVGYDEYAVLGGDAGGGIALQSAALHERLTSGGAVRGVDPRVENDIAEEWRHPGTWMFGRGALDMKSGLAAGVAALAMLRDGGDLPGQVMFVATPDEENQSAGMLSALPALHRLKLAGEYDLAGVLNLDYVDAPCAYRGAMGKSRIGAWVLGVPAHAGAPFEAVDAIQIAADLALRASLGTALMDRHQDRVGPPPVVLRLHDLKLRYDVQTAAQAALELNVLTYSRPPAETLEKVRALALISMREILRRREALRGELTFETTSPATERHVQAHTRSELQGNLTWGIESLLAAASGEMDPEGWIAPLRDAAVRAKLLGPAVVLDDLKPSYPAVAPTNGPLSRAAGDVLKAAGIEIRPYYPFITDASLTRNDAGSEVDIVTLGPWGRDAHGLFERVNAPYAFERLPRLIVDVTRAALAM